MQITIFDFIVGLAGLVSLAFNVFQLYKDRINRHKLADQTKLHKTTLIGIWQGLTEAADSLKRLEHKGANVNTIVGNMTGVIDTHRITIGEFLEGYYGIKPDPKNSSNPILDSLAKKSLGQSIHLINGEEAITVAMTKAVEASELYIFTIGGRSRNEAYLEAVKQRVLRGDVRYIRVITGDHIRHQLCKHIRDIYDSAELGYLPEDKYGGVFVTHNTVILALQSSRVSSLDKGLWIQDEGVASDYRLYAQELLSSSNRQIKMDFIQKLCTTCRQERVTASDR